MALAVNLSQNPGYIYIYIKSEIAEKDVDFIKGSFRVILLSVVEGVVMRRRVSCDREMLRQLCQDATRNDTTAA